MKCAQSGCDVPAELLAELGAVPRLCPTCNHPLLIVVTPEEAGEIMGLPVEAPDAEEGPQE